MTTPGCWGWPRYTGEGGKEDVRDRETPADTTGEGSAR